MARPDEKLPPRGKTSPGRGKMSRSDKKGNLSPQATERVIDKTR